MTLHSIGQATPAWLTQVLCAHGLLAGAEILEVRRRPCNQLATSGAVYRLEVVYSIPCQASDSFILKLPAFEEVHRRFYFERGFYAREVLFYREFSQRTPSFCPTKAAIGSIVIFEIHT